jgi:hypothetical protein
MQTTIEFSHAPLTPGATEGALVEATLRFETEVLAPRPEFSFHALLRADGDGDGLRYAHLVAANDGAAFDRLIEQAPHLPAFQALSASLDTSAMIMQRHRPLSLFRVPARFAALEIGTFELRRELDVSAAELERRAAAVREGYLSGRPEHLAQAVTELGEGRYAEVVFGDSLAHVKRTCAGYLEDPTARRLIELFEPASAAISYWLPLLARDLSALRTPRAA